MSGDRTEVEVKLTESDAPDAGASDIDVDSPGADAGERLYFASQYQLMWRKFKRNRAAQVSAVVLGVFYLVAIFCEIFAPSLPHLRSTAYIYAPPQRVRMFHEGRIRTPFVYGLTLTRDPVTFRNVFTPDKTEVHPLRLFVKGPEYKLWGLVTMERRFIGTEEGPFFLLGADKFGRDLLTRILYGSRISLSIGIVGVLLSFLLGLTLGGISGFYGGTVDLIMERVIEFLRSIPTIPLWMALAAALPPYWSPIKIYLGITVILSLIGWTGLARIVRSKLLQLREEDFVMAAKVAGATDGYIIARHLIPSFMSYVIVALTLAVPGMILAETGLSFLGLGLRPPTVSWGVLLNEAQSVQIIALAPWLLLPGVFVIITVLAFNFLGDGLRDAADPYGR
jgi:peptide/nickel transport system permease protein